MTAREQTQEDIHKWRTVTLFRNVGIVRRSKRDTNNTEYPYHHEVM